MSYSAILIPGSGVIAAYSNTQELSNAIGLFLIVWFMFTAMLVYVYSIGFIFYTSQLTTFLSNQPSCNTQEYLLFIPIHPTRYYIPPLRFS